MCPGLVWLLFALSLLGLTNVALPIRALAATNQVVLENQQPGSSGWRLGGLVSDDSTRQIKGYASATSVNQNQSIVFYVTVNPVQSYRIDIYRVGWYGGLGGRLRLSSTGLQGTTQQPCTPDATTGLIACNWTPSYTLTVPGDWTSGVYLAMLTNAAGYQNYVIFVVKDGRPADFVYQESVNTSQAYNNYPDDGVSGKSLYGYNSKGPNTVSGGPQAVKVSFDRPFAGQGVGLFLTWDVQLVHWLEQSGYDVTYTTDVDTHADPQALLRSRSFISGGHDEYWSKEMFDAVQAARDGGVNLAFMAADELHWQVRYEPSAAGVPNRVMVGYKDATTDPVQGPTTTVQWRNPLVNRPGQLLTGVDFAGEVNFGNNVGYVVTNSSHWVYAGTGLKDGDVIPGLVGYEMDRYFPDLPAPSSTNRTLLSHSPFTDIFNGASTYANSSIYQAPSGAWVFAAGTMSWSWGLDSMSNIAVDSRIQRMTSNIFNAFLNGAPRTPPHDLKVTAPATATAGQAFTFTVLAEDAAGSPVQPNGPIHFTSGDTSPGVHLPADSVLTNGQGTFSATLDRAGSQTITASDAADSLTSTVTVQVGPGPVGKLALISSTSQPATAGMPISFTATAQDQFGNVNPSYAGIVHFTSSDRSPGVALPPDSPLTNGQQTFSATLDQAGSQTIIGTDRAQPSVTGGVTVVVNAAPATHLVLATTAGPTATAGTPISFTATAQDQFANVDTSYAGTVHFDTSDQSPGVALPPDSTLTNGQQTFSATLDQAGLQTITGTDIAQSTIGGSVGVQIIAADAANLSLMAPDQVSSGQPFNVVVTLTDQFGNVATGYGGVVHFSSTDFVATQMGDLPPDYTFNSSDAGTHAFSVTLVTPFSQTITVTDTANPGLSATSPPIAVMVVGLF